MVLTNCGSEPEKGIESMERRICTGRVLAIKSCELASEDQVTELLSSLLLWIFLLVTVSFLYNPARWIAPREQKANVSEAVWSAEGEKEAYPFNPNPQNLPQRFIVRRQDIPSLLIQLIESDRNTLQSRWRRSRLDRRFNLLIGPISIGSKIR